MVDLACCCFIHAQNNNLVMGMRIKETGDLIVNGSPDKFHLSGTLSLKFLKLLILPQVVCTALEVVFAWVY